MKKHELVKRNPVNFTETDGFFGSVFVILYNKTWTNWGLQKVYIYFIIINIGKPGPGISKKERGDMDAEGSGK